MIINQESQDKLGEEINSQLQKLAEFLQDNPQAYKLCYEISGRFISYTERARTLAEHEPKQSVEIGGY